jgi:hypothetical protein
MIVRRSGGEGGKMRIIWRKGSAGALAVLAPLLVSEGDVCSALGVELRLFHHGLEWILGI